MYDIAVIGGGPAGLSAAIQARARNKSVLVVSGDDRDNPLYKTSRIDNYLGFYNVTGPELLKRFRTHAGQMGVERRDGRVLNLLAVGGAYYLSIGSEVEQARAVVLATGVVPGEEVPGRGGAAGRGSELLRYLRRDALPGQGDRSGGQNRRRPPRGQLPAGAGVQGHLRQRPGRRRACTPTFPS